MAKKSTSEVKALLAAEKADALASVASSKLETDRGNAVDYYMGDMAKAMPSLPDRSSAVSTDVADTVEGLMPSLIEIFTAGDEVVVFEPVGAEDEEAAKQETDYINHVFMQKNPGFLILYSFIKDALLSKVGVVKVWWSVEKREERETYLDLSDDAFGLIANDNTMEIVEHSERPAPMLMAGAPAGVGPVALPPGQPQTIHDVTVVKRTEYGCAKVEPVPPEEFGISRRAKSVQDSTYCFHETVKTADELVRLGYDKKSIDNLPADEADGGTEATARDTVEENTQDGTNGDKAVRPIKTTEHYIRMDYDGAGVRWWRAVTGGTGGDLLEREGRPAVDEVDGPPFAAMTPVPVTHRFFGRSVADLVMDIQRIKTALLRGQLDNIYLSNNNRTEVAESHATANTIDDILNNRPGGLIRVKAPGGIREVQNTPLGNIILPMIDYLDATREWRTGVTRQGQGIDANALQNQTAEAVSKVFSAAQARMRLIGRIFAETGIKDLFSLLHGVVRKNETQANTVKLRNKWVQVDPRQWKTRTDMTVNVGIGTGNKEQQLVFLMSLLGVQKEALMAGLPIVTPEHIYNTVRKVIELGGLKSPDPYIQDPKQAQPQPPKPDPKMAEVEAKAKAKHAEMQLDAQLDQQKMQQDGQIAIARMRQEGELKMRQLQAEGELKLQQMQAEFALEREQMQAEMALAREKNVMGAAVAAQGNAERARLSPVRMGGKVG